jgi:NAD(P)-dependent dehydrogenase (short-subunit alcohol dehydrogenase family)
MPAERKLEGKVAIVTGAGSSGPGFGVGKAISVLFARQGAKVVLVDMFEDRARETLGLIQDEGGEASVVVADLTEAADCQKIIDETVARYGGVDILINNAAHNPSKSLLDTTPEMFQRSLALNLTAPFLLTRGSVPLMIERGGGSIIYVTSIAALRGQGGRGSPSYAAAKKGMEGLMIDIASAYGRDGIRVNCVAPGLISTPMRNGILEKAGLDREKLNLGSRTSLGFEGDAWDIAHATLYLCSNDARYVTGHLMPIDGGVTMRCG